MAPQRGWLSRGGWIVLAVVALGLLLVSWSLSVVDQAAAPTGSTASMTAQPGRHVGGKTCISCHTSAARDWQGSHHDLAMQPASEQSVLGDFNNARFTYDGITTTFFKRDGKFFVRTDGPDGKLADFEIRHAFGVSPLQQYLIELPGGRLQALSIAWDSRPKEAGGQRWFHLYPKEKVDYKDVLHWTRPFAELEPHVRRVPLDRPAQELRRRHPALSHHLDRHRRVVRGLPWPGLESSGLGQARGRLGPHPEQGAGRAVRRTPQCALGDRPGQRQCAAQRRAQHPARKSKPAPAAIRGAASCPKTSCTAAR